MKSREGKRTLLSIVKAGKTVSVGVGEGGGDRKTAKKENREDSL